MNAELTKLLSLLEKWQSGIPFARICELSRELRQNHNEAAEAKVIADEDPGRELTFAECQAEEARIESAGDASEELLSIQGDLAVMDQIIRRQCPHLLGSVPHYNFDNGTVDPLQFAGQLRMLAGRVREHIRRQEPASAENDQPDAEG